MFSELGGKCLILNKLKKRLLARCAQLNFATLARDLDPFVFSQKEVKRVLLFPEFVHALSL